MDAATMTPRDPGTIKRSHTPAGPEDYQAGREIPADSYTGEIGLSGDMSAEATWEWDEDKGTTVLVLWTR